MSTLKTYAFTFAFLLLIPGINCKKSDQQPERPYIQFPVGALEYVKLIEGNYRVYKDTASGDLDSVVITNSFISKNFFSGNGDPSLGPSHYYEDFILELTKWTGTSPEAWFEGIATTKYGFPDMALMEKFDISCFGRYVFYYPAGSTLITIPSITIEGKDYNDVILGVFESGFSTDPEYNKRTYFWAKGVGIIKREIARAGGSIKTHTLLRHN